MKWDLIFIIQIGFWLGVKLEKAANATFLFGRRHLFVSETDKRGDSTLSLRKELGYRKNYKPLRHYGFRRKWNVRNGKHIEMAGQSAQNEYLRIASILVNWNDMRNAYMNELTKISNSPPQVNGNLNQKRAWLRLIRKREEKT